MSYHDQNLEWENLGETISDIVDRAVNSQNYQKLNQTVRQAVNQAVNAGSDALRGAMDSRLHTVQNHTPGSNKNVYSSNLGSMSARRPQQPPKQNLPVIYRSASGKKAGGIAKTVGGSVLSAVSGIQLLFATLAGSILQFSGFLVGTTVVSAAMLAGGIALLGSGVRSLGIVSRYDKYVKTLGKKTYCTLEQLSRSVGKSVRFVKKDLKQMIGSGLFLEGHLDAEETSLITSHETFHHYEQSRLQLQARQQEESRRAKEQEAASKGNPQVREVLNKGDAFVKQIRYCNDLIPGEEISRKIYRMENIVQKIFERAEAHPEIIADLKKLMDYYLPMTVKLLNAYADMDRQPVQGETIQSSKREIEETLDTLNTAFEKLLDSVFKETALDVSSDISVLQTLLAQEGLTDDGLFGSRNDNQE